ncbi:HAD-IA family hydrolase [Natronosporangium hydrolyticum]|uniref:HAD-IA family hydrolase n=1 Tax=Natronosporangium hydrolyticum TaxID=2811111 RepID=A0A895YBN3_9ACTN|nr:HAD-IA family hydrolase [Natronosporangium hydrolyticum]QSB15177.1 HAD-IA family hydrolase [Natronosporangium hydrolyticum]
MPGNTPHTAIARSSAAHAYGSPSPRPRQAAATTPPYSLAQVLGETGPLLLDFDGPVCALYAAVPAATVAERLCQALTDHGFTLPRHIADEPDALAVLRHTVTFGNPKLTARVDDELRRAERHAIDSAAPTRYAREIIVAAHHAGRPLAIVSNNAESAIRAYLTAHRLARYIDHIVGRPHGDPGGMKPNPAPVHAALTALAAQPSECALIGDSTSDITAGHAAGVRTIGYANKPGKYRRLTAAGADAVADGAPDFAHLARLLHNEADPI